MFRGAFILVPIAHVMRQRAARREEESSNFTSSETHSPDSPQGRHYFGWLDYKMCSLISCQGCPKNTSLDLCLTRECKLDLRFDYDNCLQLTIREITAVVNELEFSYFQPTLIYPTPTSLYYLLRFGFIFPRRTYLGSLAEKSWQGRGKKGAIFHARLYYFEKWSYHLHEDKFSLCGVLHDRRFFRPPKLLCFVYPYLFLSNLLLFTRICT